MQKNKLKVIRILTCLFAPIRHRFAVAVAQLQSKEMSRLRFASLDMTESDIRKRCIEVLVASPPKPLYISLFAKHRHSERSTLRVCEVEEPPCYRNNSHCKSAPAEDVLVPSGIVMLPFTRQ